MKYSLSQPQWSALVSVLESRGFEADWPFVWDRVSSSVTARTNPSGNNIQIAHCSGYTFIKENIDSDAAFNAVVGFIEKMDFDLPATANLKVLAGSTGPKYFMSPNGDHFEFVLSNSKWPETARSLPSAYTWRTAKSALDIKVRGKTKFKVAKSGKFGLRSNENSEHYAVKPEDGKEYRITKKSYAEAMDASRPLKGRPPKISTKVAAPKAKPKPKPKTTKKPATKLATAPKVKSEKSNVIDFLTAEFGKGWTARKIKTDLQGIISLKKWPTTKRALFDLIEREYGNEIINMLQDRSSDRKWLEQVSEQDRNAISEINDMSVTTLVQTLQKSNIDLPAGSTTDPSFKFKMAKIIVEEFGAKKAIDLIRQQDAGFKKLTRNIIQNPDTKPKRKQGDPKPPSAGQIKFNSAKLPMHYTPMPSDDDLTASLKIALAELWKFAGAQLRPTVHFTTSPFKNGHAVLEYLQVDTSQNDLTDNSADQFFDAFTSHFKSKTKSFWIEKINRTNKGKIEDEAEIILRLKAAPLDRIKLKVRINPKRLDSLYTKNNLMLSQASLKDKLVMARMVKNTKAQLWNLTISVERLKPREFKLA